MPKKEDKIVACNFPDVANVHGESQVLANIAAGKLYATKCCGELWLLVQLTRAGCTRGSSMAIILTIPALAAADTTPL